MSRYVKHNTNASVMADKVFIHDTDTGNVFAEPVGDPTTYHQKDYLDWLAEGNEPEVIES